MNKNNSIQICIVKYKRGDEAKCALEIKKKDYMLTARVYEAVKSDVEYTRDKAVQYIRAKEMIVEYLKMHGSITKATVQELCGFSEQQARRTLEKCKKKIL